MSSLYHYHFNCNANNEKNIIIIITSTKLFNQHQLLVIILMQDPSLKDFSKHKGDRKDPLIVYIRLELVARHD